MLNEISNAKTQQSLCVCSSGTDCGALASPAVGEQRAAPGSQARAEGTEGQSDPGGPAGALLQRLAALLHHQHGSGKDGVGGGRWAAVPSRRAGFKTGTEKDRKQTTTFHMVAFSG